MQQAASVSRLFLERGPGQGLVFYSCRPELSSTLETEISNIFAAGDGAGISRGLVQASVSGVLATREIIRRIRN